MVYSLFWKTGNYEPEAKITMLSIYSTGYGLDGQGIESRWGARFSVPVRTGPGAHPASCTMGTRSFPVVKSGRGVTLIPHPLPVPWSWKSYTSNPPMGRTACTESQCLYRGALYLTLHSLNRSASWSSCQSFWPWGPGFDSRLYRGNFPWRGGLPR
jgi:hypothetical protein